jgi:hypothetical protein
VIVEELIGRLSLQTKGIDKAKQATKALQEFRKALQGLAGASRVNLAGPVNAVKGYKQLADSAKKAAQAQKLLAGGSGFGKADAAAQRHLSTVQKLSAAYKEAARSAGQIGKALTPRGGSGGRSWIRDEISALRDYQRLQREIGRESGRRGISRASMERGMQPRYGGRHEGFGGGLRNPVPGGVDVRGQLDKGFDSATTIPQVQAQMRMRKESEADIDKATKLAYKLSGDVKQFTAAEHLQGIYGSLAVFGDMDKAMKAAPTMQRANALIEGLSDQFTRLKPFKGGTATKDFARIFDMMGATEKPEKMAALTESILKATEQSSGDTTPSDLLMTLKYARSARYGFNSDFLQNYLSGIIGDAKVKGGGASGAGTQLASMFDQFHDLKAPVWAIANMADLGLLKDRSKLEFGKKGKIKGKGQAEVIGKDLLRENPQKWAEQYVLPLIEKRYGALTGDDQTDSGKVLEAVGKIAGNRNAKDAVVSAILQKDERERDAKITRKMPGLAGLEELDKSPVGVLQQFSAGITDFTAALAAPAVQPALAAMKSIGDMARGITNFQRENPDVAPVVSGATLTATAGAAAGVGVVGRKIVGNMLRGVFGGGTTPGGGATPPTTPIEPPSSPTPSTPRVGAAAGEAAGGAPRVAVSPQASAMDVAARTAARAAAAAAFPITAGLNKGDQNALIKRLGAFAQEQERAKQPAPTAPTPAPAPAQAPTASTTTPNAVAAVVPNVGAVQARLSEIVSGTTAAAEQMKTALNIDGKLNLDSSALDAALAKAARLKAEIAGIGSAASSAMSGAGLSKGSNTFTSAGATAP